MLDLARELHAFGHDVKFYSYVPFAQTRRFGLPAECHVSLLPLALPVLVWQRLGRRILPSLRERVFYAALNYEVMLRLKPCDVFICMSGIYLEAGLFARRRFAAQFWLERGSHHILSQDEILAAIPGADRPSSLTIARELAGYAHADRIVIPATHVEDSFRRDETAYAKLFRNPYGVDLASFPHRTLAPPNNTLSLLFVGTWSLRKGCDVLMEAIKRLPNVHLVHVGGIGDLAFPADNVRFVHFSAVPQVKLAPYYAAADAFVLASREEGLSMVLLQALASGVPVICTDRTGGADLAFTPALAAHITVVRNGDIDALSTAIAHQRDRRQDGRSLPTLTTVDRGRLSWTAYARRYSHELIKSFASYSHEPESTSGGS